MLLLFKWGIQILLFPLPTNMYLDSRMEGFISMKTIYF